MDLDAAADTDARCVYTQLFNIPDVARYCHVRFSLRANAKSLSYVHIKATNDGFLCLFCDLFAGGD